MRHKEFDSTHYWIEASTLEMVLKYAMRCIRMHMMQGVKNSHRKELAARAQEIKNLVDKLKMAQYNLKVLDIESLILEVNKTMRLFRTLEDCPKVGLEWADLPAGRMA